MNEPIAESTHVDILMENGCLSLLPDEDIELRQGF